ncbi:MAG TPA: hypothetical protein VGB85_05060 [Nannocystis sp.]|jgi:hypothetical protein
MSTTLPTLLLTRRDRPCRASCSYDATSAVFSATFAYAGPPPPADLRRRIDDSLGIREPHARLRVGDVDIVLVERRLDSLVIRTSPEQWIRRPLGAPDVADPVWFEPVCAFDANLIAEVSTTTTYARDGAALDVRFAGAGVVRWVELADAVFAGLTVDARLCGLLFARCPLPP